MTMGFELFLAIAIMCAVTYFTRLFPFVLFGGAGKETPPVVLYLGKYLPPAIICAIIVYCFRNVDLLSMPFGACEIVASLAVVLLQLWKNNSMLSIFGGTGIYMLLLRFL